jgi:hypothetical protein
METAPSVQRWSSGAHMVSPARTESTQARVSVAEFEIRSRRNDRAFDAYPHRRLQEWRVTDQQARKRTVTQSVWKLNCGVSVGGQTLLGITHLHQLAEAVHGQIWPFCGLGNAVWSRSLVRGDLSYARSVRVVSRLRVGPGPNAGSKLFAVCRRTGRRRASEDRFRETRRLPPTPLRFSGF